MNKFSSIVIIDSRKNYRKYRVYHAMFWAIYIAKQVCNFLAKSIFQWYFAELSDKGHVIHPEEEEPICHFQKGCENSRLHDWDM